MDESIRMGYGEDLDKDSQIMDRIDYKEITAAYAAAILGAEMLDRMSRDPDVLINWYTINAARTLLQAAAMALPIQSLAKEAAAL